ncbi:PfkB family carbohydrate kinase [uncultured Jannaschia sp.]|uniref:PfkB family carbohydrate kinase n=1 Tax=uncultured Jannaschia sp. TaxID=293347 RepID=UPI00261C6CE7|nr:PfkB family carbohydrate kinase [uncultured Jannaschia sp.]
MIGNVTLDEIFAVENLPQEGASIFGTHRHADLGGKGANQAVMLARCGLPVRLRAAVGVDPAADIVRSRLAAEPVEADLYRMASAATDRSIILSDAAGMNVIVTTTDCARALRPADALEGLDGAGAGDLMVLQGNLTQDATKALIQAGRARGMRIALNPSPIERWMSDVLSGVDFAFVNEAEAEFMTGTRGEAAVTAMRGAGAAAVVLTSGERGALLGYGGDIAHVPARRTEIADTTGAGDTFQSVALASALRRGGPLSAEDLELAAVAASLTVSRFGSVSAMPTIEEMGAILDLSLAAGQAS